METEINAQTEIRVDELRGPRTWTWFCINDPPSGTREIVFPLMERRFNRLPVGYYHKELLMIPRNYERPLRDKAACIFHAAIWPIFGTRLRNGSRRVYSATRKKINLFPCARTLSCVFRSFFFRASQSQSRFLTCFPAMRVDPSRGVKSRFSDRTRPAGIPSLLTINVKTL